MTSLRIVDCFSYAAGCHQFSDGGVAGPSPWGGASHKSSRRGVTSRVGTAVMRSSPSCYELNGGTW